MVPAETDVVIVGGGPAGLAAALAARRSGFDVVVVDRAQAPIDKACGEGLMPDGLAALRELGVELGPDTGQPFAGIRFLDDEFETDAAFPNGYGLGIRRTRLHAILSQRATQAGVGLFWQPRVAGITPEGIVVGGQKIRSRWIIGADGLHSQTRDWAHIGVASRGVRRIGVRQHFRTRPWTNSVEVYWRNFCQAYVTPTGPDEVCIAIIGCEQYARIAQIPALFPKLAKRLSSAIPSSAERGSLSTTLKLSAVTNGRVALVGDASGCVDAVTGEGLAVAFRQAQALGVCLAAKDLARYEVAHRRLVRMPRLMARLLLLMDRDEILRKRTMRKLIARPQLFPRLLAMHVGALRPWEMWHEIFDLGLILLGPKAPLMQSERTTRGGG